MPTSRSTRIALYVYGILVIFFLYLPLVSVAFASVSKARYLSFPIKHYSTKMVRSGIGKQHSQQLAGYFSVSSGACDDHIGGHSFLWCTGLCAVSMALPHDIPKADPAADFLSANCVGAGAVDVVQLARDHPHVEDRGGGASCLDCADCHADCLYSRLQL